MIDTEVSVCYRKGYKPSIEQQKRDAAQVAAFVAELKRDHPPKEDKRP